MIYLIYTIFMIYMICLIWSVTCPRCVRVFRRPERVHPTKPRRATAFHLTRINVQPDQKSHGLAWYRYIRLNHTNYRLVWAARCYLSGSLRSGSLCFLHFPRASLLCFTWCSSKEHLAVLPLSTCDTPSIPSQPHPEEEACNEVRQENAKWYSSDVRYFLN